MSRSYLRLAPTLVLFVAALLLPACRSAERDARRIAEKNAAARGGRDAWQKVRSLVLSGRLDAGVPRDQAKLAQDAIRNRNANARRAAARRALVSGGGSVTVKPVQLPFSLALARTRRTRLEIRFAGDTAVQVFDGQQGWKLRPFLGRREVESYTPAELEQAREQTDLDGPLMDYTATAQKLELVGTEKVDGHDTHKIAVTTRSGAVRHVWVDTQTNLELRSDTTRQVNGKPRTVWTYYRDYRPVEGLQIPHTLETMVEGIPTAEQILIDKVEVNPPLPESRFAKPSPEVVAAAPPSAVPSVAPPSAASAAASAAADRPLTTKMKRAQSALADYALPAVTLTRDDGQQVALGKEAEQGRLVILNFIFTTCQSICPVMSQVFSQLQDKLGADRDKVLMMSISIDPEHDTPARLREYAQKFHAGPQWRHYTGTSEASVATQRAFDTFRGDKMGHTPLTFLRRGPGHKWVRIDGFASPDELASAVRELLAGG